MPRAVFLFAITTFVYCNSEEKMYYFSLKTQKESTEKRLYGLEQAATSAALSGSWNKRTLRRVHPPFMRTSDACVLEIESDGCMSKDPRHLTVTERPPRTHSYFCHTLLVPVASLLSCCDAAWRHGRTHPGGGAAGSYVTWAGPW